MPLAVLTHISPEAPNVPEGAPAPQYHFDPSTPAGPVGPGVPVDGTQAVPLHTRQCPALGAVAETARPWSWVALPLEADDVE
jgi:hypothetical protein